MAILKYFDTELQEWIPVGSGGGASAKHAENHAEGGSDPITPEMIGAQAKLTGVEGQMVGFDAEGNVVAMEMPESGMGVNDYVWAKKQIDSYVYHTKTISGLDDDSCFLNASSPSNYTHIRVSDTLDDAIRGVYTEYTAFDVANRLQLQGKYIRSAKTDYCNYNTNAFSAIFYVATNATMQISSSMYVHVFPCTLYYNINPVMSLVNYVNSPDINTYPPEVDDGLIYEYLGQMGEKTRIAKGSYIGTGKYGESNKNTLTFDFEPRMVVISGERYSRLIIMVPGRTQGFGVIQSTVDSTNVYYTLGKTTQWWVSANGAQEEHQANTNGFTYYYFAIG